MIFSCFSLYFSWHMFGEDEMSTKREDGEVKQMRNEGIFWFGQVEMGGDKKKGVPLFPGYTAWNYEWGDNWTLWRFETVRNCAVRRQFLLFKMPQTLHLLAVLYITDGIKLPIMYNSWF